MPRYRVFIDRASRSHASNGGSGFREPEGAVGTRRDPDRIALSGHLGLRRDGVLSDHLRGCYASDVRAELGEPERPIRPWVIIVGDTLGEVAIFGSTAPVVVMRLIWPYTVIQ